MSSSFARAWRRCRAAALSIAWIACASAANAQFRIFYWDSFEENGGKLPQTLVHTNDGGPDTTMVFDLASPAAPPGILGGIAATECDRFGLRFVPKYVDKLGVTGLVHQKYLERQRLGASGCALVQADIYLPPRGTPMANVAVVAQQIDPAHPELYYFYRFGLLGGGSDTVYFSFLNGSDKPVTYLHAKLDDNAVKRPGWHRFQMIFYGQDKIYCALDTKFTPFSPIVDPTLKRLAPGVLVAASEKSFTHGPVYCDNLSIQWTPVATPDLPESPWIQTASTSRSGAKLIEADSVVGWQTSTKAAWDQSQKTGKPILVLFYIPNLPAYKHLSTACPNDEAAKAFFARFVPLRIDVNQLGGGQMAERFGVLRVPMFMAIRPDGQPGTKVLVENGKTQWADIVAAFGGGAIAGS